MTDESPAFTPTKINRLTKSANGLNFNRYEMQDVKPGKNNIGLSQQPGNLQVRPQEAGGCQHLLAIRRVSMNRKNLKNGESEHYMKTEKCMKNMLNYRLVLRP